MTNKFNVGGGGTLIFNLTAGCYTKINVYCRFMNPPLNGFISTNIIALNVLKRNER